MLTLLLAVTANADSLCTEGEKTRFSCGVKGEKTVSVCEVEDDLIYRFGKAGAEELTLKGADRALEVEHQKKGNDAERFVASFWNEGYRYAVVSDRTEDAFEGRVAVRKGLKEIVTLKCTSEPAVDFTDLGERYRGDATKSEPWLGYFEDASEQWLEIIAKPDGSLYLQEGYAEYQAMTGPHMGTASGPLKRTAPGKLELLPADEWSCHLIIERPADKPGTLVVEDNKKCGGMNVTFDGTYYRKP